MYGSSEESLSRHSDTGTESDFCAIGQHGMIRGSVPSHSCKCCRKLVHNLGAQRILGEHFVENEFSAQHGAREIDREMFRMIN